MNEISVKAENNMTFGEMQSMASVLIKSGFLPAAIKTEAQAVTIMLTGKELNLGLMESLRSIHVIQGKPTMSAQLLLGLCYRTGQVEKAYFEKESSTEAIFILKRKGNEPIKGQFSIEDAKRMGFGTKDNWVKQPGTMLKWRAISMACRLGFPDAISGVYETTEMQDSVTEHVEVKEEPKQESKQEISSDKLGEWILPQGKYAGLKLSEIWSKQTGTGRHSGKEYIQWLAENATTPEYREICSRFIKSMLEPEIQF